MADPVLRSLRISAEVAREFRIARSASAILTDQLRSRTDDDATGWTCSECQDPQHGAGWTCDSCGARICRTCRAVGAHRVPDGPDAGQWCRPWKKAG